MCGGNSHGGWQTCVEVILLIQLRYIVGVPGVGEKKGGALTCCNKDARGGSRIHS